ncbi:hypothetical protein M6G63_14490 [Pseudomonas sp. BYT-5]|uniref:hypothetical protein n=1 Tax=unclassified Pseudomonas TaxID=196821 RepID=UPI0020219071|nr:MULTISPECIES: hypothetical protein [unclassified Pseudomonas]URD40690.1 hypothetical protein M6G63_14490 [Pseudomonas sp. BYT-5]URK96049.1 hypothetical protein J5X93_15180 [Pseudomonas sp. BYT-1]
MSEKIELDLDAIEAAAKAATPQDFVNAQVASSEDGWIECPNCGGEGSVELTADYLNYDGVALGVQFYGIGEPHVHAEAHYRAARPAVVTAMVEEIRNLRRMCDQLQADLTERDERIDQLRSGYVFETGPYEVELSDAQWSAALGVFDNYNMGDDRHFVFLEEQGRGVISEILIEIGVARAPDADEVSE